MESVRVDRWLTAARIFKSRTAAHDACAGGRVEVNGAPVRPSHLLQVGDELKTTAPRGPVVLTVRGLAERRVAPPQARELYEDRSPPPPPRPDRLFVAERGTGRPTKRDRRALLRLRGDPSL